MAKRGRKRLKRDYPAKNRRRGELIDKDLAGTLTEGERKELSDLEAYVDAEINRVAPYPTQALEMMEKRLGLEPPE